MKRTVLGGKFKNLVKKILNHNKKEVPRGYFPVDVIGAEAEVIRYDVSIEFLKTESFKRLLDEYNEEIQMHTRGPITLPCPVYKFEAALYLDRIHSRMYKK